MSLFLLTAKERRECKNRNTARTLLHSLRSFAVTILCCTALLFPCLAVSDVEDHSALLAKLENSFSSILTVQARLRQEKKLKIFNRTIMMEGRLASGTSRKAGVAHRFAHSLCAGARRRPGTPVGRGQQ